MQGVTYQVVTACLEMIFTLLDAAMEDVQGLLLQGWESKTDRCSLVGIGLQRHIGEPVATQPVSFTTSHQLSHSLLAHRRFPLQ